MYDPKEYWENRSSSWIKGQFDTDMEWEQIRKYIDPNWKVLEIGCGTGRWSQYFKNYEGWDISEKLIEHAKKTYPNKKFKVQETCGEINGDYDLIFSYTSLLHVKPEVLSKIKLPDTRLLFIEPYHESNVEHCFGREYDKYFDVELLETIGCEKVWGKGVKKTVSVILPTYNGLEYIAESIDSILNQTYKHFELIIVDDGSTDDISDIINFYSKDKRVKYFKKENGGTADALNYGIERSSGDVIMFTADDDISLPDKINLGLSAWRGYDLGYTGYYHANPKGEIWYYVSPKKLTEDNIINNDCCSGEALVFSKELWRKIPFRNLRVNEDMAWLVDAYKYGITSNFIDKPTFKYRMLSSGLSYARKKEVDEISLNLVRELNEKKVKNFRVK